MNGVGPCACGGCGWDAGGDLRVHDWWDDAYPPGPKPADARAVTTDDGPDDPRTCPECGEDLWPESVVAR